MVLGFVKGYIKYTCNYFIMFKEKSLAKLCLRAPNDISNVLPPNICQCLQCISPLQAIQKLLGFI